MEVSYESEIARFETVLLTNDDENDDGGGNKEKPLLLTVLYCELISTERYRYCKTDYQQPIQGPLSINKLI